MVGKNPPKHYPEVRTETGSTMSAGGAWLWRSLVNDLHQLGRGNTIERAAAVKDSAQAIDAGGKGQRQHCRSGSRRYRANDLRAVSKLDGAGVTRIPKTHHEIQRLSGDAGVVVSSQ